MAVERVTPSANPHEIPTPSLGFFALLVGGLLGTVAWTVVSPFFVSVPAALALAPLAGSATALAIGAVLAARGGAEPCSMRHQRPVTVCHGYGSIFLQDVSKGPEAKYARVKCGTCRGHGTKTRPRREPAAPAPVTAEPVIGFFREAAE